MYYICRKYKIYFWRKYDYILVKVMTLLVLAKLLDFRMDSDITRLSWIRFADFPYPSKANFEAQTPIKAKKIKLLQVWRLKKCEIAPLGGFWQKCAEIGDSKKWFHLAQVIFYFFFGKSDLTQSENLWYVCAQRIRTCTRPSLSQTGAGWWF